MARGLGGLLLSIIAAGGVLVLGLAGSTLRTGRLDPLDWLVPAILAIGGMSLFAGRGGRGLSRIRLGTIWAACTLPALLFILCTGMHVPLPGMALLALLLCLAVILAGVMQARRRVAQFVALGAMIAVGLFVPRMVEFGVDHSPQQSAVSERSRPVVATLSDLPLQGVPMGAAQDVPAAESIGLRSPIWVALEQRFDLRALDGLDEGMLADVQRILLAQPRALAPAELVALDAWVRRGGEAVILSDPLLQWPDHRPLAHPARAPLTSLLDPLLTHWGLRLESAEIAIDGEAVERRGLDSGMMVQLAGASRFRAVGDAQPCALSDAGLIATCKIGAGRALLMADADWINDTLWTLSPQQPRDRRATTSDAVALLDAWLGGDEIGAGRWSTWVAQGEALIMGLRLALLLALLLAILDWLVARRPSLSQRRREINIDQIGNINKTSQETG